MVPKRRAAKVRWWWIRWPQGDDGGWSRADGPFPAKTLADFMKILEAVVPGEGSLEGAVSRLIRPELATIAPNCLGEYRGAFPTDVAEV